MTVAAPDKRTLQLTTTKKSTRYRRWIVCVSLFATACATDVPLTPADKLSTCAYSCTRYIMLSEEFNRDMNYLYSTCGYYKAAGEALSSKERGEEIFSAARERYYRSMSLPQGASLNEELTLKRRKIADLEKELEICTNFDRSLAPSIKEDIRNHIQKSR